MNHHVVFTLQSLQSELFVVSSPSSMLDKSEQSSALLTVPLMFFLFSDEAIRSFLSSESAESVMEQRGDSGIREK